MKFKLPPLKILGQLFITLLFAIMLGTILLILSYTIPIEKINAHVEESVYIFQNEGVYPSLNENYISKLDNYTDALMLEESVYEGSESAFEKAMLSPRNEVTDYEWETPVEELILSYSLPQCNYTMASYARYWHGYLIFLKPMLLFLNYGQIRTANLCIQMSICIIILALLVIKKVWQMIPAFAVTVLMLRPCLSAYSMQHANVYYIILISMLLLILLNERLKNKNGFLIFFLVLGAATSYFDYLTYPLTTFGIPAAVYVFMNRKSKHSDLRILINLLVCWGIGYIGMWAGKWILATIFTDANIIKNAIETIKFRSGNSVNNETYSYIKTLHITFDNFIRMPYTKAFIIIMLIEIAALVFQHKKPMIKESVSFIFIMMLPLLWYAGTINHSVNHATLYTYKEWSVTTFSLMAMFANVELTNKDNTDIRKPVSLKILRR